MKKLILLIISLVFIFTFAHAEGIRIDGAGGSSGSVEGTAILSTGEDASKVLTSNGSDGASWEAQAGGGDLVGPGSATDGVPALFDGITGKLLKNSIPTGTGNPVMNDTPTLVTPELGEATATSVTISQKVTPQELELKEGSGDGTNYHTLRAQAMAANRLSLLPDYVIGFLLSTEVTAGGSQKTKTPVSGTAANFLSTFTGENLYGGTYVVTTTGTCQLPVMVAGMHFTIKQVGAIEVIVDTNAADGYLKDGVFGVEGANMTNLSAAQDMAVFRTYDTDDWLVSTNGWTAE